jgi:hypothetical protein
MSSRVRFIDLVRPVMGLLPEVEQPLKKVSFIQLILLATIQRQVDLDFHHFVHLFDLLPDPTIWYCKTRRCRSSLLVESYLGLQQGYPHGIGYLPHHYLRHDHATPRWC